MEPHYQQPKSGFLKFITGALVLLIGFLGAVTAYAWLHDDDTIDASASDAPQAPTQHEARVIKPPTSTLLPPASAGTNGTTQPPHPESHSKGFLKPDASSSFASLEQSLSASIGLVVAPLGSGSPRQFGRFQSGHAWSSIKVPILVSVMREGSLSAEDQSLARSALTASDNEAAAALFQQLESAHGGLSGASLAVDETLAAGGDPSTTLATAPPPPGAVSTYGQTDWSLSGAAAFYRGLACGVLLDGNGTGYVLDLMEEVIPEQRWGLGATSFSSGTSVAYKAGWGPEGSAAGPYLVRQSGVLRKGNSGVAVAMMAEDSSGSFEAGVQDLDAIASWLSENLGSLQTGPCRQ
jgi:hypothetical protein